MLIKVQKSYPTLNADAPITPAYTLFDNVDQVLEFHSQPNTNLLHNEFEVDEYHQEIQFAQTNDNPSSSSITFRKDNKVYEITFDTMAYICNDKGDTLEKCFAGGTINK